MALGYKDITTLDTAKSVTKSTGIFINNDTVAAQTTFDELYEVSNAKSELDNLRITVTDDIQAAIAAEVQNRQNVDNQIQADLANEATQRANAIQDVSDKLGGLTFALTDTGLLRISN